MLYQQMKTLLTCENGWHHGTEHKEKHSEENTSRIAYYFGGFIANPKVNHPYEQANNHMRQKPHLC